MCIRDRISPHMSHDPANTSTKQHLEIWGNRRARFARAQVQDEVSAEPLAGARDEVGEDCGGNMHSAE
eukprot:2877818-Pyramimonas_sp.AAC.1